MDLVINKARPEDAAALAEILTQAMRFKLAHDDKAWGSEPYTPGELHGRIEKGIAYAAWLDGSLVATLLLLWEDEMMWGKQPLIAAYVHQLAVKDSYHGRGIGEKLLDWAGQQAATRGRRLVRIDCPPANTGLRTYYETHGFRWVKNREIHAPDATYTAALYERPVQTPMIDCAQ